MRSYKFLIMKINGDHGLFTGSNFSGGRCTEIDANETKFEPHDFGGGHENDDYWNYAEELLVGFSQWYNRVDQKESYNMGNRIYAANATYRFFRVDDEDQLGSANLDLKSYEISEEQFIKDILNSWVFKQVSSMFRETHFIYQRPNPSTVYVQVVYNKETNTWCWISDYLEFEKKDHLYVWDIQVPSGKPYDDVVTYIKNEVECDYRFGGNDGYNKRKNS